MFDMMVAALQTDSTRVITYRLPTNSLLLDNSLIAMGSGLRTGHKRRNLPILFAGGGIRQGQHVVYKEYESPLGNLWLSMLKHVGCPVDTFADSNKLEFVASSFAVTE